MTERPQEEAGDYRVMFVTRRYSSSLSCARGVLGAVPLADLVLIVALFLLVAAQVVVHPGVRIELPTAVQADGVRAPCAVVVLAREGMMFFDDERTEPVRLATQLAAFTRTRPDATTLLIQADGQVGYEQVLGVYASARAAGFDQIWLGTARPPPAGEGMR